MKITKRAVDAMQPGPAIRIAWDNEIKGFGVRITPAGVRSFVLRYRNTAGPHRQLPLIEPLLAVG